MAYYASCENLALNMSKSLFPYYFLFTTGYTKKTGSPGLLNLISKVSSFDRSAPVQSWTVHNIKIPQSMQGIFNACVLGGNQCQVKIRTNTRETFELYIKHSFFVSRSNGFNTY